MAKKTAWDIVMLARDSQRPKAKDYIENIVDDFIEFHGDRCFGDDKSIIGGIGRINGKAVTIIGQEKGSSTRACSSPYLRRANTVGSYSLYIKDLSYKALSIDTTRSRYSGYHT